VRLNAWGLGIYEGLSARERVSVMFTMFNSPMDLKTG
jgi:hypothetical protein